MKTPRWCAVALATVLVLSRTGGSTEARAGSADRPAEDLAAVLEPIRQKYELPGLVAAVVRGGDVVAAGAVGVREASKDDKVELDDRFHIGSCTKTMTAMLIAGLVDRGKLTWETTLAEALPGVEMRPEYHPVTIRQLLTFRAGIQPYTTFRFGDLPPSLRDLKGDDPADVRLQFARAVLNEPPVAPPGTKAVYSNAAYAIAGAIIDRLAGRAWEAEMVEGLFRPLRMTDSVVGQPRQGGRTDQPIGHRKQGDAFQPVPPDEGALAGGPGRYVIAPAGNVSCSILDFARYAAARLAGVQGKGPVLSADSYAAMRSTIDGADRGFTGGTGVVRPLDPSGREFAANGSGGRFFAGIRLLPEQDAAIVVATNAGSAEAVDAVVAALKDRFKLPK